MLHLWYFPAQHAHLGTALATGSFLGCVWTHPDKQVAYERGIRRRR